MASYGPRRIWAERLAADGVPVVRIDLPGTADSAGEPQDGDLVQAWTDAVASVTRPARWLREESGCATVVALTISIGGLLALRAACACAAIDHFALWACQPRGTDFDRELRAFSRLEQARLAPRRARCRPRLAGRGCDDRRRLPAHGPRPGRRSPPWTSPRWSCPPPGAATRCCSAAAEPPTPGCARPWRRRG